MRRIDVEGYVLVYTTRGSLARVEMSSKFRAQISATFRLHQKNSRRGLQSNPQPRTEQPYPLPTESRRRLTAKKSRTDEEIRETR